MNKQTEIRIVKIEPTTPDTQPVKGFNYSGRPSFLLDVNYTLADGRVIPSKVTAERKKNIPANLAREQKFAAEGGISATFSPTGEYWGTVTRFSIG